MKLKQIYLLILRVIVILIGLESHAEEYKSPIYPQYVAEITRAFSKQMKKEFNLECEGNGGCMPYDVEEISIDFVSYQRATVEQARELEVLVTEKFVQMINAHEKIKPFLRESPFPASRTCVGISFCKKNNKPYIDGSVAHVTHINSRIYYCAEDPDNQYVYKDINNELYEDARKTVSKDILKSPQQKAKNLPEL